MIKRKCRCKCHYDYSIMHVSACCDEYGMESVPADIEFVNPRLAALGYKFVQRNYVAVLVKVRNDIPA